MHLIYAYIEAILPFPRVFERNIYKAIWLKADVRVGA